MKSIHGVIMIIMIIVGILGCGISICAVFESGSLEKQLDAFAAFGGSTVLLLIGLAVAVMAEIERVSKGEKKEDS